jgi:hypothetical protein
VGDTATARPPTLPHPQPRPLASGMPMSLWEPVSPHTAAQSWVTAFSDSPHQSQTRSVRTQPPDTAERLPPPTAAGVPAALHAPQPRRPPQPPPQQPLPQQPQPPPDVLAVGEAGRQPWPSPGGGRALVVDSAPEWARHPAGEGDGGAGGMRVPMVNSGLPMGPHGQPRVRSALEGAAAQMSMHAPGLPFGSMGVPVDALGRPMLWYGMAPGMPPGMPPPHDPLMAAPIMPSAGVTDAELEGLVGKVFKMATDQHGCRVLQKHVETNDPRMIALIFGETIDRIVELMTDPFGATCNI